MLSMAMGVTWPIMVLKAKETMTPIETPLLRVLVSKTSAGTIPGEFSQHLSFDCIALHLVPSNLSQW